MSFTVAFLHRDTQLKLLPLVADILSSEYQIKSLFIQDIATVKGYDIFAYEPEIEKRWDSIDISYEALQKLQKRYPDFNFMRALYSEREFNYFPFYYGDRPVDYEHQIKYMVGCFGVFERFFESNKIGCIISELISSLDDAVLSAVAEKNGVMFYSIRQSKMTPGFVVCDRYYDVPNRMRDNYRKFLEEGMPDDIEKKAKSHITELRDKINFPSYMEVTKRQYRWFTIGKLKGLVKRITTRGVPYNSISLRRTSASHPLRMSFQKKTNIYRTKWASDRLFTEDIQPSERFFVYPFHYEPEASTTVRAFYFSDQIALIKQIAKLLPLGVRLVVKEHRGNHGYRKYAHYHELSYLPNVLLVPRDYDVRSLIKKSLGIITLTGRMGWEAIANNKPVIAFGKTFWTSFDGVFTIKNWKELKSTLNFINSSYSSGFQYDQKKLIGFAAAYIACVHEGSYVVKSKEFATEDNARRFVNMMLAEMLDVHES